MRHVGPALPLHSRLQSYMVCYVCACVCVCVRERECVRASCALLPVHSGLLLCVVFGVCMYVRVCESVCEREFCSMLPLRWYLLCCGCLAVRKG